MEKDVTPTAAYKTCMENILLGVEVGGDEAEDIPRDEIDASEPVPPLANRFQRS